MTSRGNYQWKMLGILFGAFFLLWGIGLSLGLLLAMPLVGWAMQGALHFPVSPPELFRLACLVLGMTVVTTLVMWLEGKWRGRW
jgi:hypothetical protein